LAGHLVDIIFVQAQLVGNLLIGQVQAHKVQTQDPNSQRLVMTGKNSLAQIIEGIIAILTQVSLAVRLPKTTLVDMSRAAMGTPNPIRPSQFTHNLITFSFIN